MSKVSKADDFMKLLREGKNDEARAMIEDEMAKAEFAPDEVIEGHGRPAVFKRRGRLVVLDKDGTWRRKNPPRRSRKRTR